MVDGRWTVEAKVVTRDPFWCEHHTDFTLVLFLGAMRWRFRSVRVRIGGGAATIEGEGRHENG